MMGTRPRQRIPSSSASSAGPSDLAALRADGERIRERAREQVQSAWAAQKLAHDMWQLANAMSRRAREEAQRARPFAPRPRRPPVPAPSRRAKVVSIASRRPHAVPTATDALTAEYLGLFRGVDVTNRAVFVRAVATVAGAFSPKSGPKPAGG